LLLFLSEACFFFLAANNFLGKEEKTQEIYFYEVGLSVGNPPLG
jgi:hypothetical protein